MTERPGERGRQSKPYLFTLSVAILLLCQLARSVVLAQPGVKALRLDFWWSGSGLLGIWESLPPPSFLTLMTVGAFFYLCSVAALYRWTGTERSKERYLAVSVILVALASASQTHFISSDLLLYQLLGEVQVSGDNPYVSGLTSLDKATIGPYFPDGFGLADTVVYGPLTLLLYKFHAMLVGSNWSLGLLLLKLENTILFLWSSRQLYRLLRLWKSKFPLEVTALWALNPLMLSELLADAHNDMWLLALVVWAVTLAEKGKKEQALAVFCLLPFMKITSGLLLLFYLAHSGRSTTLKQSMVIPTGILLCFLLSLSQFGLTGLEGYFNNIKAHTGYMTNAFPTCLLHALIDINEDATAGFARGVLWLTHVGKLLMLVPLAWMFRRKTSLSDFCSQSALALICFYLLGSLFIWPHYFALPLLLGLLGWSHRLPLTPVYLTLVLGVVQYTHIYPHGFVERSHWMLPLYLPAIALLFRDLFADYTAS